MPTISIVGDSFGCGEWIFDADNPDSNKISHPGLQSYLEHHGFQVSNFSSGGSSMQEILKQIVDNNIFKETIIVFATDPLRKIKHMGDIITKLFIKKDFSIAKLHKVLYLDWLKQLEITSNQRKCDVILVGGHANLYNSKLPKNISVCTKSWLSDILQQPIGDLSGIDNETIEVLMSKKTIKTDAQKAELVDIMTQRSNRLYLMSNNSSFPDDIHPDKSCHKLLAKKIIHMLG